MTDERAKRPQRPQAGGDIGLSAEARKHIGRMLKATYDEVVKEPVPDKFRDLLKQLEAAEPQKR
jgi:hypothetical protein